MTWAEVKKQIEDAGVSDDMEMWYIDISFDAKLAVSPQEENGQINYGQCEEGILITNNKADFDNRPSWSQCSIYC